MGKLQQIICLINLEKKSLLKKLVKTVSQLFSLAISYKVANMKMIF